MLVRYWAAKSAHCLVGNVAVLLPEASFVSRPCIRFSSCLQESERERHPRKREGRVFVAQIRGPTLFMLEKDGFGHITTLDLLRGRNVIPSSGSEQCRFVKRILQIKSEM